MRNSDPCEVSLTIKIPQGRLPGSSANLTPHAVRTNTISPGEASQIHTVIVGGPQDLIVPNFIIAAVGDIVQFQFSSGNHTITEGIEGSGCQPLQKSNPLAIHSGHLPYNKGDQNVMVFNVPINDLNPRLLYCATGPHCQTGQVAAINPSVT